MNINVLIRWVECFFCALYTHVFEAASTGGRKVKKKPKQKNNSARSRKLHEKKNLNHYLEQMKPTADRMFDRRAVRDQTWKAFSTRSGSWYGLRRGVEKKKQQQRNKTARERERNIELKKRIENQKLYRKGTISRKPKREEEKNTNTSNKQRHFISKLTNEREKNNEKFIGIINNVVWEGA